MSAAAVDVSLQTLQARIGRITREQELDARIAYLQRELADAQAQRRILAAEENVCTDVVGPVDPGAAGSQEHDEYCDGDDGELPDPIWDEHDRVYRCVDCAGEVVEGQCQFCASEHTEKDDEFEDKYTSEPLLPAFYAIERGLTPPAEDAQAVSAPPTFPGGDDAYRALLLHGATPAMIELFRLEWNALTGITAWATEPLFDAWAGPALTGRRGQAWKIVLGRRVALDGGDADGARWVRELLDECLDPVGYAFRFWETVEERPGVWVTRRISEADAEGGEDMDVSLDEDEDAEGEEEGDMGDEDDNEGEADDEDEDEDSEEELPEDLDADGPIKYWDDYENDSGIDDETVEEQVDWRAVIQSGLAHDSDDSDSEGIGLLSDDDGGNYSTTLMSDEDGMDCDARSDSETTDSDQPGSDWDSQEELSGDEVMRR
ncbi:hypothetical protein AURDEDRAFT_188394 [Auricularia subglabra TFB-10046 SS5]|uniref:Uncharacterized protein n=1 Tax=Auricularia subglabra (strain TFB-10046 / SS5) TaxID=717982 RepID=J0D9H5_AURST|nr:hypothetical protein AURDEDRAFT_188394 [Auricularia subglabra TFB-10046 SS5]